MMGIFIPNKTFQWNGSRDPYNIGYPHEMRNKLKSNKSGLPMRSILVDESFWKLVYTEDDTNTTNNSESEE